MRASGLYGACFALMGACLTPFILAWAVVRLCSVTAAVVMPAVPPAIAPVAVSVADAGDQASRRR